MHWSSNLTRFVAVYAMLYGAFGIMSPFLPEFLRQRGLTATEIGAIIALGTMARLMMGPLAGRVADRYRSWRGVLFGCTAGAGLAALLYLPAGGFGWLLAVGLIQAAALAPLPPLADAMAVSSSRNQARRFEYGWVRGSGSAAFIVGLLAGGQLVGRLGMDVVIWGNAILLGFSAIFARALPNIAVATDAVKPAPQPGAIRTVFGARAYRRLLVVAALILGSHALHDTFAVISWRAADISSGIASVLWSESVISEVIVFFVAGPFLLHRLGPAKAATLAAVAGAVRWSVFAATTHVVPLALVEPLHGLTFALLHLTGMQIIASSVDPEHAGTAQSIYGTVAVGASTALLAFVSGWLYGSMDRAAFWIMALLCLAAVPLTSGLAAQPAAGTKFHMRGCG